MAERRFPWRSTFLALAVLWMCGSAWCAGAEYDSAACVLAGTSAHIAFGGYTKGELFTVEPVNTPMRGARDGWFAVIDHCPPANDVNGAAKAKQKARSEAYVADKQD